MKNPFGQIVSFEDYVDIIGIPKEQLNSEEVKNRINKWLVQATEQFDSMISGNGQLGRLYRWFEKLEDNEEDNYKKYKLIKAICSWVETFVIKGKFWVDGLPVINSNVDIQINSSSNDSNVEAKRKDIIQDLVSVGLYQTTNFGDNNTFQDNQQNAEQLIEDLIVLSTSELQQNYLKLNPQKSLEGNLDFANNDLVNGGNIIGSTQHARNNIQYYNIIDSTIDLNKNTIIGSLPQDPTTAADIAQINQNIASINQEQITQNTNISNNANEISSLKAKDIEQNNRLTQLEQETEDNFNEIANIKTKDQQQDNTIQSNTTSINTNTNSINTLNQQVANNKNLLDQTIDGLRALKPFEYVGEFQQGTSYNINQLVSYNNNLYLSKENNNNTTPPSDKWLLINKDTVSVDLSDYYNKLEVDQIKTTLENNITSNTNNITTITQEVNTNKNNITNLATVQNQHDQLIQQNKTNTTSNTTSITNLENKYTQLNDSVVKIAGQQIITGKKIFTGPGEGIQIRPNATSGSSYITGYDLDGKIKKWVLGNTGKNEGMLLEAPQGNIYLKPSASNNGYIDCYNAKLSRIANPTANTDAANKLYVDNAIKNANLGGGTGSGGTTIPSDLVNRVDQIEQTTTTNTSDIQDLEQKYNQQQTTIEQNKNDITNKVNQVEQNVNTNSSSITDLNNKHNQQQTLINTNKTNIETNKNIIDTVNQTLQGTKNLLTQTINELRTLRPFKYVGAYSSSKTYMINEMVSLNNAFYLSVEDNNSTTPSTNNNKWIVMENFQQVDLTKYATKLEVNNAKTDLQNKITTNTSDITYLQKNTVNTTNDQTINGIKTFAYQIKANGGITNLIDPTNATDVVNKNYVDNNTLSKTATAFQTVQSSVQFIRPITVQTPTANTDAANKQYVDNKTSLYTMFSSNTIYNNLQKITTRLFDNSAVDYNKPLTVSFTRTNNSGTDYGSYTFQIQYGIGENNFVVGSNLYYDRSKTYGQLGDWVALTITPSYIQVQCWNGGDRIKNIKVQGWKKV